MKKIRAVFSCALLALTVGCSHRQPLKATQQVKVVFEPIPHIIQELCTNDTLSRTDYINVPVVRLTDSKIVLNGSAISETELLDWGTKKFANSAEQYLWVQVSPQSKPFAEQVLSPLVQSLPRLHLREVDSSFACPKL